MAIYIKGMGIPYSCSDCILSKECKVISRWLTKDMVYRLKEERHPNCPLVEVKEPHGRLIDADIAYDKIGEQEGGNLVDMDSVGMGLEETPTVIERSEE